MILVPANVPPCAGQLFHYASVTPLTQETLVLGRVHLHVAFRNVQRRDRGVREPAGQDAAEHALGVVRVVMDRGVREPSVPLVTSAAAAHRRRGQHATFFVVADGRGKARQKRFEAISRGT